MEPSKLNDYLANMCWSHPYVMVPTHLDVNFFQQNKISRMLEVQGMMELKKMKRIYSYVHKSMVKSKTKKKQVICKVHWLYLRH
jgi:hypothetical protein